MIIAATEKDYPIIAGVWELSVRATHHFLPESYLQEIKTLLPSIFPHVAIYTWRDSNGVIKGFAGVADHKIEMLFVHPGSMGQGIGRQLTDFCINVLKAGKVDVNEQNEEAALFYKKMGFVLVGRQELDGLGRPFPLLQMEYPAK